jgi:hypothetical protein
LLLMAGIRERDKRAMAGLDSTAYKNFVPRLFYVRNMFFLPQGYCPYFEPEWPQLNYAVS